MASIFLSYARDDHSAAKRTAAAVEAAGHSVWWDRHLKAGSRFSREIDAALRAADLVVVLWSHSSIESAWVQDEAGFGRDHGRLLPVLIDEVEPPLGFRQFQAMAISRSARKYDALLAAIAAKLGEPVFVPKRQRFRVSGSPAWRWGVAAFAVMAMLAALLVLFRDRQGGPSHVVAVIAAEGGGPRSQELARTIAADLGRFRAGPLGSLTVLGGKRSGSRNADYRVEAAVSQNGSNLRADVSLLSPKDSQILWTTSVDGPADRFVDLHQRAVAQLGDVLACAVDATTHSRKLSVDVMSLYLNGCGRMSDLNADAPDPETLSILRQVTERAPDFAPGWANLALIEVQSFPGTASPDRAALADAVTSHLARAKQLGPDLPATIATIAIFHPEDATKPAHALAVLDKGLEKHPDSALLHDLRSSYLRNVGRLNEGVSEAERALALNPLSPAIRDSYLSALAYSGRIDAAYVALREADAIWPGSTVLAQARYRLDLRYGDPKAALRSLRQRGAGDLRPVPMDTAWEAFLQARISPSPVNVEKALDAFRARYRRSPGDVPGYLQALGHFGRVDEAFEIVKNEVALDSITAGTETLFRPHMRAIRADPRFIALAAKLGLVQYWEKTDVWPDFCRESQLPYDCKKEAAKLTPEQRRLAKHIVG